MNHEVTTEAEPSQATEAQMDGPDQLWLIAAYSSKGRIIGNKGQLPWRQPEDLKHFKTYTLGHAVIMGRVSYDSLGKPLPGRVNVVLTRDRGLRIPNVHVCYDLKSAIAIARNHGKQPPFIIGGQQIYDQALKSGLVTKLILTEVQGEFNGDAFFPEINEDDWTEESVRRSGDLVFRELIKVQTK